MGSLADNPPAAAGPRDQQISRMANQNRRPCGPKTAPLKVVVIEDPADLEPYVAAWDALAEAAVEANVFYESWMLRHAVKHYGTGRRLLFVLVVQVDPARPMDPPLLCGLFPLERRKQYKGLPVRVLRLWQFVHCYFCVPLVRQGYGPECLDAFFNWLATTRSGAALLECPIIAGEGPFYRLLVDALNRHNRPWLIDECYTRAVLCPRNDGEEYLKETLSGVKRKKLRSSERRLSLKGPVRYTSLEPGGDITGWLEDFLQVEASGWKGKAGTALACNEADRQFFLDVASEAFRRSRVMLLALEMNGRFLAHQCNFLAGDGAFAFKVAFDEQYASFSPGILLELENIRRVHSRPEIQWMDSCTHAGPSVTDDLWRDRRVIKTVIVAGGQPPDHFVIAVWPLLRWLRQRASRLVRRFRVRKAPPEK